MPISRLAVIATLLTLGCASAPPIHDPSIVTQQPVEAKAARCTLSTAEVALLNARWRALKRQQAQHVGSWSLQESDISEILALSNEAKKRRALERLYEGRFGNTVFFRDGLLTGGGIRARIVFGELTEDDAATHEGPTVRDLEAQIRELRVAVESAIDQPLSDRDIGRICGLEAEAEVPATLRLDVLTGETLRTLDAVDHLQADLRRAVGVFDATLVLASWRFAKLVDGNKEKGERLQMPTWLVYASKRTGDVEALSRAVFAALKYDGFKKPYEEVGPIIRKVILSAEDAGIDPLIAVTLVFMESRFRPDAVGDGGRACGLGQQHPDFSMNWGLSDTLDRFDEVRIAEARRQRRFNYECNLLKDPDYAMKVMLHLLNKIKERAPNLRVSVCRYNEGPFAPCEGRGLFYLRKHEWWRELIRVAYDRILSKQEQEAARESDDAQELGG